MLKIDTNQNNNYLLTKEKVQDKSTLMIQKLSLSTQMIWIIFRKIMKYTIQMKNEKY